MRRFCIYLLLVWSAGQLVAVTRAEEFKLNDGEVLKGDLAAVGEDGFIVALDVGGFSQRVGWAKLTQETLKRLSSNPKARAFVEPFIEIPLDVKPKRQPPRRRPIQVKPVPQRAERPAEKPSLFAAISTPSGLTLLAALYFANLFAAFEIAVYRRRPIALVGGLSAVLPLVGPIIFLSLPRAEQADAAESGAATQAPMESGGVVPTGAEIAAGTLTVARAAKSTESNLLQPATYNRGEFTLNRRFFETKFPGFFRVVLSDAEKSMVIMVRTGRQEYPAKRISRISAVEVHLVLAKGEELSIPFTDITQVELRRDNAG